MLRPLRRGRRHPIHIVVIVGVEIIYLRYALSLRSWRVKRWGREQDADPRDVGCEYVPGDIVLVRRVRWMCARASKSNRGKRTWI